MEDLTATDLDGIAAGLDQASEFDAGTPHPGDSSWRVKEKEPAGDEEPSLGDDLREALREPAADNTAADADWSREQRRLADAAMQRWGVDPGSRHEHGLSRREVARRLFQAEASLKSDPARVLPMLASDYAGTLDPGTKEMIAREILARLGYDAPDALDQSARQRLAGFEGQERARQSAVEQAVPRIAAELEAFKAGRPDFAQLQPLMSALVNAGAASTIADAYALARQARGLPAQQVAAAQAEAEKRRSEVAKAKAAGTPQTRSSPGKMEHAKDQSLRDDLRDALHDAAGA